MKTFVVGMLSGVLVAWLAGAGLCEDAHGGHGNQQTLQGEVLDMACFMAHEGKGEKHKKCAAACLKDGTPAGLLTKDGQVYLLLEDHNAKKPYENVKGMAAEQVKVTGLVSAKGGVQAVVVKAVEKVK